MHGTLPPVPILDQGARGMCLAMAATSSHERARAERHLLSPEALWQYVVSHGLTGPSGSGTTVPAIAAALSDDGQPALTDWPFDPAAQDPQAQPEGLHAPPWFLSTQRTVPTTVPEVRTLVSAGETPIIGVRLAEPFYTVGSSGLLDPIASSDPHLGGHAVSVVATGVHPVRGDLFAVRNSWGTGWGAGGYAWIDEDSLAARLIFVARVTSD